MISVKIEWRETTGKYTSGAEAFVGTVRVGSTFYGGSKQPGGPWTAGVILPGINIKDAFKYQLHEKHARTVVELAVTRWFNNAAPGLTVLPDAKPSGD